MRAQRGSGYLEFALVVALFAVLGLILLWRLDGLQGEAERLEVELTVRNIRVGMQWAVGEAIMRGEEARIADLAHRGPVEFLGHAPRDFVAGAGEAAGSPGQWRWDATTATLRYRPRHPDRFGGATELRWRVEARADAGGRVIGAALAPQAP